MVVSKVLGLKMFRGITTEDVKKHLQENYQKYNRVCELANHPDVIGFLERNSMVCMRPEKYETHIKVISIWI
jgi:hypothetical protein